MVMTKDDDTGLQITWFFSAGANVLYIFLFCLQDVYTYFLLSYF